MKGAHDVLRCFLFIFVRYEILGFTHTILDCFNCIVVMARLPHSQLNTPDMYRLMPPCESTRTDYITTKNKVHQNAYFMGYTT